MRTIALRKHTGKLPITFLSKSLSSSKSIQNFIEIHRFFPDFHDKMNVFWVSKDHNSETCNQMILCPFQVICQTGKCKRQSVFSRQIDRRRNNMKTIHMPIFVYLYNHKNVKKTSHKKCVLSVRSPLNFFPFQLCSYIVCVMGNIPMKDLSNSLKNVQ